MAFYADLNVTVPDELAGDFLAKLHYVCEGLTDFAFEAGRGDRVRFELASTAALEPHTVAARIAEVAGHMCDSYHPRATRVLRTCANHRVPFGDDPHPLLEAAGQLKCYGAGRYGLGPLPLRLLECFEQRYRELSVVLPAADYRFPSLIGADVLDRCRYIRTFPHSLSLVCHLREDLQAVKDFAHSANWKVDHLDVPTHTLAPAKCLLSPTICFHHYAWLENTRACPDHTITALGRCYRYESGNLSGLERLWDFSMREFVYAGTADYVLRQRQHSIDFAAVMLDEWELNYDIVSASDPFFIEDYSLQVMFQKAFDLKFEVTVPLPYRSKALAIGSFNYHQDFFGRSLNIRGPAGEPVHTGCVGFGLERVVLGFLTQYGVDLHRWPAAVKEAFEGAASPRQGWLRAG